MNHWPSPPGCTTGPPPSPAQCCSCGCRHHRVCVGQLNGSRELQCREVALWVLLRVVLLMGLCAAILLLRVPCRQWFSADVARQCCSLFSRQCCLAHAVAPHQHGWWHDSNGAVFRWTACYEAAPTAAAVGCGLCLLGPAITDTPVVTSSGCRGHL